jgi:ABC-type Zn uptake system ZnuABC Zn-binding protein ZnuA
VVKLLIIGVFLLSSLAQAQSLQVVTSFSILEDLVKNVGRNNISITNFVPRDGDTHSYQPSATDVKTLAKAQIVFLNGAGLETWFAKLAKNAGGKAQIIELASNLTTRKLEEAGHEAGHKVGHEEENDPHVWWNPSNAIQMVNRIRNALSAADKNNQVIYWTNAAKYTRELANLDVWAKLEVKKIPVLNRKIVTNHDSLGYLADHYGFKVVGTIIPSGSTERAPSAKETAELIRIIRREKVKAIFTENIINPKLAQTIARETNAKIAPALYTDSLGALGSSGETFLKAFRHNIQTLVAALR